MAYNLFSSCITKKGNKKSIIMIFHNLQIHLIINLALILAILTSTTSSLPLPPPNCTNLCGNVTIPYPFGTTEECSQSYDFLLTCNQTFDPPKPFFVDSTIEITHISLDGQLTVLQFIGYDCYDQNHTMIYNNNPSIKIFPFTVNNTANKFTIIGCDAFGFVYGQLLNDQGYTTGCTATCDAVQDMETGSCTGLGCCQTSIPKQVWNVKIDLNSYNNYSDVKGSDNCSYAFVAEESAFTFSAESYAGLKNVESLPMVVDWTVGNGTCEEVKMNSSGYACKSVNSECYKPDNGDGYRCSCVEGYRGNPYLVDGCQDIDECHDLILNDCEKHCVNTPGSFYCFCPKAYHGDGKRNGQGCIHRESFVYKLVHFFSRHHRESFVYKLEAGVALAIILLLLSFCWLHLELKRRKLSKKRRKFFLLNGGLIFQEKLTSRQSSSSSDVAEIFEESVLQKATNNFHESMIVGQGGFGTVYKGVLPDNRTVAIKKSKEVDPNQIDQFTNEVIVLSQINHRNVVKLLGCCLETPVPLLVYEFITNGTLYEHIHNKAMSHSLSWEKRLRIATETAGVLSYLHSAASRPIIHRDIKSANILLDHTFTAKVSDFGTSRLVPLDKTEITTLVQGTLGYLDPEYMQTNQLTEKSDVYSFGVVLVELLSGRKAVSKDRPEEERSLANFFLIVMKGDSLFDVLDDNVATGRNMEKVMKVAVLAERCLNVRGHERPFMKEVAMELERLCVERKQSWIRTDPVADDTESYYTASVGESSIFAVGFDSLGDHAILPPAGGR